MTPTAPFTTLPGPPPMPVFGWRGNMIRFFADPIGYMAPLMGAYGEVVAFSKGGGGPVLIREGGVVGTLFALGPACHQTVLGQMSVFHSTRVPGPAESKSFARITSGLFNMNDDRHRQQKRLILPAFHKKRLDGYHATMVLFTEQALAKMPIDRPTDIVREMERLTLAVTNQTLFGLAPTEGVMSLGERIQEVVALSMSIPAMVPLDVPGSPRRRLIDQAARTEEDLRAVIAERRRAGSGEDVLATLLATRDEDGAALTDDELIGQLFLLFLAGHDTTKSALAWTLFLLTQHPDVLRDVQDEIRSVLRGSAPSAAEMGSLPLLERVIKESLRLFPTAPLSARLSVSPSTLGGIDFPTGTEVIISPYCLHRNPDIYPEPQRFRPERWESFSPSPFEYAPFGAGARMCIGAGFAMMELKTVLAILLGQHGIELLSGARVDRKTTIVMSPRNGLPMILRKHGHIARPSRVRGDVREMVDLPD